MSTPLIAAAQMGNIPEIQRLLAAGADINATDRRGMSALHHALSQSREAAALEFLQHPEIDVSIVSHADGKTILMRAVEKTMKKVIQYLVEHFPRQMNCLATDNNGESALFYAIDRYMYAFPIIQMLVEHCGLEIFSTSIVNVRSGKSRSPIEYARILANEEVKELTRLDTAITKKRERGEEPSAGEIGMYNFQKIKLDKLLEIIGYLESHSGGAGAGARHGGGSSRQRRRTFRRHKSS